MEKEWGNIDDTDGENRVRTDYRHIIVRRNHALEVELPTEFDKHKIEYLDDQGLIDRYKSLGKGFTVLEILPMLTDGKDLRIHIVQSWLSSEEGRVTFAISDWSDVWFSFDCGKQRFDFSKVEIGGI
jgi:hypothetical protein